MVRKIEDTGELELCCFDTGSLTLARTFGIGRVEYCLDYAAGGLWPGKERIREARDLYPGLLSVMVRVPGRDFNLRPEDRNILARQIREASQAGADGITTGALNATGGLPLDLLADLMAPYRDRFIWTFHRAFDRLEDPEKALEMLAGLGFSRVLSSGGTGKAVDHAARLGQYTQWAGSRLTIVAAGGVRAGDIPSLKAAGVIAFHSAASGSPDGHADPDILQELLQAWQHSPTSSSRV